MNIDELLAEAVTFPRSTWRDAEIRHNLRSVEAEALRRIRAGEPLPELDMVDPLRPVDSEAARITRLADQAGLGTFTWTEATNTLTWSPHLVTMLDHGDATTPVDLSSLIDRVHRDDQAAARELINNSWRSSAPQSSMVRIITATGEVRYLHLFVEVLLDRAGEPTGLIGTVRDVTETEVGRRELERVNRRLATVMTVVGESLADRDPHTGLRNRRRFIADIDQAVAGTSGSLLFLGVGGLEDVNRRAGSLEGDEVVRVIATNLRALAEQRFPLARVGGNKFGILMPGVPVSEARDVAQHVLEIVRTPSVRAGGIRLTGHIGLVGFTGGELERGDDLLIDADLALHEAKRLGTDIVEASCPLGSFTERKEQWQKRVRHAIREEQFLIFAQPILNIARNTVNQYELLLRLSEGDEIVTPSSFLPTAERLGLIRQIDYYVISQAVELLARTPVTTHLNVNLSGHSSSNAETAEFIRSELKRCKVSAAGRLTIEVTETALIGNITAACEFANRLHDMDCLLALDDFGSAYASLSYLKHLPFDVVKIDGELVKNMAHRESDQIMVKHVAAMCADLGISTVAEFVEDPLTLDVVRGFGVEYAQGYLIGRPCPAAEVLPETGSAQAAEETWTA